MKQNFWSVLAQSGSLSLQDVVLHIGAAALLGAVIYLSFWYTHAGSRYSKSLNVSLVTLTVLAATVMTVIGDNVALALGLVGALSVVRFRAAVRDCRETTYIFWAVIVGVCCGAGEVPAALVGTGVVFLVLLLMGRGMNEGSILLVIRGAKSKCLEMEGLVYDFFGGKALLKEKGTTADTVELTFEMPRSAYRITYQRDHDITDKLYALGGVEYVNIVTQSDEIPG